jgi:site-specific recombinase XerD
MTNCTDFGFYLTKYLSDYLPNQINASKNTTLAYRDTFALLLEYLEKVCKISPENLTITRLDAQLVANFLAWLESDRNYSISSRNHRLAIIRAFFKYLHFENPKYLAQCQDILGIRHKKTRSKPPAFLSKESVTAILAEPDTRTPDHFRDLTLLSIMYDTGARVQEICDLRVCDVNLGEFPSIMLTGKGNKSRNVPIMAKTSAMLEKYITALGLAAETTDLPLFRNHTKQKLTRNGITYILKKYVEQIRSKNSVLLPDKISPHMMRHSKAMHLVQAGVNIIYIRDFLGHTNIKATEIYARADGEMKRIALSKAGQEKISPNNASWSNDTGLVAWLKAFGK